MVTSVVADILVLIVGVAVVNEFLEARSRRRWRRVAEYPDRALELVPPRMGRAGPGDRRGAS